MNRQPRTSASPALWLLLALLALALGALGWITVGLLARDVLG